MFVNVIFVTMLLCFSSVDALSEKVHRPDSHSSISVMGDHTHKINDIMFSYRFGQMEMGDMYDGDRPISTDDVMFSPYSSSSGNGTYMNSPLSMTMEMHMFGIMYAPSNKLTLMLMGNYQNKDMTQKRMRMSGNGEFTVNSKGFGDLSLFTLHSLIHSQKNKLHIGLGLSIPTGSINKRDATPANNNSILGYAMQKYSGTYDPQFLIHFLNKLGSIKLNVQINHKIRIHKNAKGYGYGDKTNLIAQVSYQWSNWISQSVKLSHEQLGVMRGEDNEMNKRMSPAMDSYNNGYKKTLFGVGFNLLSQSNILKNHRLGIEASIPLYQDYKGIQMSEDYRFMIGWQYALE